MSLSIPNLEPCSECGHMVSRRAEMCPNCGVRFAQPPGHIIKSDPPFTNALRSGCAVFLLLGLAIFVISLFTESSSSDSKESSRGTFVSAPAYAKTATNKEANDHPTPDEQRLLAAIPELEWDQKRFVAEGWMKPGQKLQPKANHFSKAEASRFGVNGEIGFLFVKEALISASFYIQDGEVGTVIGDDNWVRLYKSVKMICLSPEERTGDTSSSSTGWTIIGETKKYDVKLTRRVFGKTIERGLEIIIWPIKK